MKRLCALAAAMALCAALLACAAPRLPDGAAAHEVWSGRLSLKLQSQPPQSFFAAFTLQGDAQAGQLALFAPLGGTLAQLHWSQGAAQLVQGNGQIRHYASLDALTAELTGAAIPVPALLDWLRGQPTPVAGWSVDLDALASKGRISATRHAPSPAAHLQVLLQRP